MNINAGLLFKIKHLEIVWHRQAVCML